MESFDKAPQEIIAEKLARFTVRDLIQQSYMDLDGGEYKLSRSNTEISVVESGETNFIRWWKIDSSGNRYEVRRFENFVFCSCLDFFYNQRMCKHLAVTVKYFCDRCRIKLVDFGSICDGCQMDLAPYLKQTANHNPVVVGRIRI